MTTVILSHIPTIFSIFNCTCTQSLFFFFRADEHRGYISAIFRLTNEDKDDHIKVMSWLMMRGLITCIRVDLCPLTSAQSLSLPPLLLIQKFKAPPSDQRAQDQIFTSDQLKGTVNMHFLFSAALTKSRILCLSVLCVSAYAMHTWHITVNIWARLKSLPSGPWYS